ncbi:MAG TPA: proton-conducting transporter membrane subunit [Candidatus Limnocylindrales bacterium]|jgi:formate hydrogenlyase subunit 3/multisubunit Na+/H+ antiporter MnhD subunit
MSVLPVALIALLAGLLSLALRPRRRSSVVAGLIGLAIVAVAATTIRPGDSIAVGGESIIGSAFVRLFVELGAVAALLLATVGVTARAPRSIPGIALIGLGTSALALASPNPDIAVATLAAGSIVSVIAVAGPNAPARVTIAARALRAVVVSALLAMLAVAWGDSGAAFSTALGPQGGAGGGPILGLAYLAAVGAVALRAGAIPTNAWALRLADIAPMVANPIVMAWGPAALAVVLLTWTQSTVGAFGAPLAIERTAVIVAGAASIILGAVAAHLHDDVEHIVGYSIVQDAGVVLLAFGTLDPTAQPNARTWILAYVVVKSAFGAWAAAVSSIFGTRRLSELRGWARRAPLHAVALMLIAAGSIGLPGLAAFDARVRLIGLTLDWPLDLFVYVGAIGAIGYYVRILLIGIGPPSPHILSGATPWPRWPRAVRGASPRRIVGKVPAALRMNRAPIGAVVVLALAILGVVTAAGGLGVPGAAFEPPFAGGGGPGPGVP